jgi:hypothetical protein
MEKRCISTLSICLSPSVKETSYFMENAMKTFPQQHISVHSWNRDKYENQTMYAKRQLSNLIHIARQMHVCKPKQTLPFPLQHILVNARRPVIFSPSWFPSPRFELKTLAGYITQCLPNRFIQDHSQFYSTILDKIIRVAYFPQV